MTIASRIPFFYIAFSALLLLTHACGSQSVATHEATISPTAEPTLTSTPTATASPLPAQATLTEFARQAEGTRQVLADTQVALEQNANATATSRALDATATALAPRPTVSVQVVIQADAPWQDTGYLVRQGDRLQIKYVSGEWSIWVGADPMTDGNGQTGRPEDCRLMPEANLSGLIGRVGENPPFFIGNEADLVSEYTGNLQLSMNDCTPFESNGGALTVEILIER
jgi:eukaryotic-like serine/threonine-protein kinase